MLRAHLWAPQAVHVPLQARELPGELCAAGAVLLDGCDQVCLQFDQALREQIVPGARLGR